MASSSTSVGYFKCHIAMYIWLGWISTYIITTLLLILLPLTYKYCILAIIVVATIIPTRKFDKPPSILGKTIGSWLMRCAAEYCSLEVFHEDKDAVAKCETCIYALEPHGVLPYSIFFCSSYLKQIPQKACRGLMTSACFIMPGMKHVYSWVSAAPVSKYWFERLLRKKISVAVIPGGVQEVNLLPTTNTHTIEDTTKEHVITVYLEKRKGFIKIAIREGVPVVPVFCFGLQKAFDFYKPESKFMAKFGRKLGFTPLMFWGAFNIPLFYPKACPLTCVIGEPIHPDKSIGVGGEIPEEMINKMHRKYIEKLTALFNKRKKEMGMENYVLKVV